MVYLACEIQHNVMYAQLRISFTESVGLVNNCSLMSSVELLQVHPYLKEHNLVAP